MACSNPNVNIVNTMSTPCVESGSRPSRNDSISIKARAALSALPNPRLTLALPFRIIPPYRWFLVPSESYTPVQASHDRQDDLPLQDP
jgi:hypothetical protein